MLVLAAGDAEAKQLGRMLEAVGFRSLRGYLSGGIAAAARLEVALDGKPLAVACSAGNRSSIAVSLLERDGIANAIHVTDGGVADLTQHGIELVKGRA